MHNTNKQSTERRQPTLLKPPGLAHPSVTHIAPEANRAALDVADIFAAPADMPNLDLAVKNVHECLQNALILFPESMEFVLTLHQGLKSYIQAKLEIKPQAQALAGRKLQYPQWDLITRQIENYSADIQALVGLELINAYLLQKTFPSTQATKLNKLPESESLTEGDSAWIGKKLSLALQSVEKNVRSRIKGLSTEEVLLNHTLNAYLMVQFGYGNEVGNQAAGGKTELLRADYLPLFAELRAKVESGEYDAALSCTAFCLGLSTPITELVPFKLSESCTAVIYICAEIGAHYCSLNEALGRLANKAPDGAVPAKKEFWRPFPEFLARYWKKAISNKPEITKVGAAGRKSRSRYVNRIESTEISCGIPITEARLIATRGTVFLHSGVQRDSAAYAALAPYLIDKADFHYIFKSPEEVWSACDQAFQYMGWGNAVSLPEEFSVAVGTQKSPQEEVVRMKIATALKSVQNTRPGKKCSLNSIELGHNEFIFYVALMMYFTFGGRNRTVISYKASSWSYRNSFGVHADKPSSPNQSRLQSPIPVYLSKTLEYLYIHYSKLDERLAKKGFGEESDVRVWIRKILDGEDVNLLFALDEKMCPRDLKLSDFLGADDEMTGDAFRHFLPKALERKNVPFEYAQAWLKHHSSGNSANSVTNRTPPVVRLTCVAAALNEIAREMGLVPVHGISKG